MASLQHRSPGLTALYNAVKTSKKNRILDLGQCIAANLQFFAKMGCQFRFENLDGQLWSLSEAHSRDDFSLNLSVEADAEFDVILCWDLLNFLSPAATELLLRALSEHCHSGTLFHLFTYIGASTPTRPCRFSIQDQYWINIDVPAKVDRADKRATIAGLLKPLANIRMLRSFMSSVGMAPGFSEQILVFGSEQQSAHSVFSSAEMADANTLVRHRFRSPVIESVMQAPRADALLLDLGMRTPLNEDAWKRSYHDVYCQDLGRLIKRLSELEPASRLDFIEQSRFLKFERELQFDVIVTWDLLNFLDNEMLEELGRRLQPLARDGTQLIVMSYSGSDMPRAPQSFMISGGGIGTTSELVKLPRASSLAPLTSLRVQKAMPGFYAQNTFAFRPGMLNGLNEYVFVFKDLATQERERRAMVDEVLNRRRAQGLGGLESKSPSLAP